MHPLPRLIGCLALATATVVAAVPSAAAAEPGATGRPIVGKARTGASTTTVTLVTGDRVLVVTDGSDRTAVALLPGADGEVPTYQTRQVGKDQYVIPAAAVGVLAAGKVDEQLFNVTGLVRQGYDDAHTDKIPLIAVYEDRDRARAAAPVPRGADRTRSFTAIPGAALVAVKKDARSFWADLTAPRSRAAAGIRKVWLDRKARAGLDRSTAQVRAPQAWAAGQDGTGTKVAVLDTGIDLEHPDLKDRIAGTAVFTGEPSVDDGHGHGTHVASTVLGSGAASGGTRKGVAPGARVLVGKVLDDFGSGALSGIIAGMEWAVAQQADVVSMSLGLTEPTDCTDPIGVAAQELSKNTRSLFVIAAGNLGRAESVSSPGCAPGVLTVGAVDRDDSTAPFSSRGPVTGVHTLKPEIAAPGVGISAAAAGGRGIYAYQAMSGTSMATPHVAGAAAILRQRHPGWTAQQLKSGLISAADDTGTGSVQETGAGRLDVAAALEQTVLGPDAVEAGDFAWPQEGSDRKTVQVGYTNTSGAPLTVTLGLGPVYGNDAKRIRSRVAALGTKKITIPAGGTVQVPLEIDPSAHLDRGSYGAVGGRIEAVAGDGTTVSTPFSLYVEPETVTLRVKTLDRYGNPAAGPSSLDVIGMDAVSGQRLFPQGEEQTLRLRAGTYYIGAYVYTPDAGTTSGQAFTESVSYLTLPQTEVRQDGTVVLDARRAHPIGIGTDRPSEARRTTLSFGRSWDDRWLHAGSFSAGSTVTSLYGWSDGQAGWGDFEFAVHQRRYAPELGLRVDGRDGFAVPGVYGTAAGVAKLDGTGGAGLAQAGTGTPGDLESTAGKVALVRADDPAAVAKVATDAKAAGAVAVLVHRSAPGRWFPPGSTAIPVISVDAATAARLSERLAAGAVTLAWSANRTSPYVYNLGFQTKDRVGGDLRRRVRDRGLAAVDSRYHAMGVPATYGDVLVAFRPLAPGGVTVGLLEPVPVPGTRTELYSPGDGWLKMVQSSFPWGELLQDRVRTYTAGQRRAEEWYRGVVRAVAPLDDDGAPTLTAERQGDLIGFEPAQWGDASGHWSYGGSFGDIGNVRLRRDGRQIGTSPYPFGVFRVPADEASYELELNHLKIGFPANVWKRSTSEQTVWRFRSHLEPDVRSRPLPILFPAYGVPVDLMNTVAAEPGKITLSASGTSGYRPARITGARLWFSYDEGTTWTEARVSERNGAWTAAVDHTGASGRQVTLKTDLTDANGNGVSQTVVRAYDVR